MKRTPARSSWTCAPNGGGLVDVAWGMADTILEKAGTYMGAIQWREDQGGLEKHYATGGGRRSIRFAYLWTAIPLRRPSC